MTCYWLYRHFGVDGVLLYVGITVDLPRRGREHAATSIWFNDVVRTTLESFSTHKAAVEAERMAVIVEKPLHNIIYRRQARELEVQLVRSRLQQQKRQNEEKLRRQRQEYFKSLIPQGREGEVVHPDDGLLIGHIIRDGPLFNALAMSRSSVGGYPTYQEAEKGLLNVYGGKRLLVGVK